VIVTGATGNLGEEVLHSCLADPRFEHVTALARRDINITNPKLSVVKVKDFNDLSGVEDQLKDHHVCYWCLGISTSKVKNEQEYRVITYDYAMTAATTLKRLNPDIQFHFVSGEGVDPTTKKMLLFARVKGETEVALAKLGLSKLVIWRPGWIQPLRAKDNSIGEKMLNGIGSVVSAIAPNIKTDGVECSKAFFYATFNDLEKSLFQNKDIKALAKLAEKQ
jgi:hypothetical protein